MQMRDTMIANAKKKDITLPDFFPELEIKSSGPHRHPQRLHDVLSEIRGADAQAGSWIQPSVETKRPPTHMKAIIPVSQQGTINQSYLACLYTR